MHQEKKVCAEYWAHREEFQFFLRSWPLSFWMLQKFNAYRYILKTILQLFKLLLVGVLVYESYSIFAANKMSTFIFDYINPSENKFLKKPKCMAVLIIHFIGGCFFFFKVYWLKKFLFHKQPCPFLQCMHFKEHLVSSSTKMDK